MSGRSFGYARVSTDDQNLTLQIDTLTKSISIDDICQTLKISRSTYYRYLAMEPDEPAK